MSKAITHAKSVRVGSAGQSVAEIQDAGASVVLEFSPIGDHNKE